MRSFAVAFIVLAATACGGGGAADLTRPSGTFASLTVAPAAPSVSVGGSVQLTVTAKDASGVTLTGLPAATYSSADEAVATVSPAGLVIGVAAGSTTITASLTADGVTETAQATVTVTPSPPSGSNIVTTQGTTFQPATLTVALGGTVTWNFAGATHNVTFAGAAPAGGNIPDTPSGGSASRDFTAPGTYDYECTRHAGMTGQIVVTDGSAAVYTSLAVTPASPSIAVGGTVVLTATPRDQNGTAMTGLPAPTFSSGSEAVATVNTSGVVAGVSAGTATITASLTAGAVTHTATAIVTVTSGGASGVGITTSNQTFSPPTVTIAPGTQVTWQFSEATHNVTFAGAAPTGGDIPDTSTGNAVSRTFDTPGSYSYECTRHSGMTGTITVSGGGGGGGGGGDVAATVTTTGDTFTPSDLTISPGATVRWEFAVTTHNVTFKDLAPPGGDIPDTDPGGSATRTFTVPGTYDYECTRHAGMKGKIRVG